MEIITSRANPLIMRMAKLKDKSAREAERLFTIEGIKLFEEMCQAGILPAYAFATEENRACLDALPASVPAYLVSESVYEKISSEKAPQGLFCAVEYLDKIHKTDTIYSNCISLSMGPLFCLCEIQDPGNLGTVMRTMRAFGGGTLILSEGCADLYSHKTVRASMGAIFRLSTLRTPDLAVTLSNLAAQGYRPCAATLDTGAVGLASLSLDERVCFVVGNEGHGLPAAVLDACPERVFIPMTGGCESLNAAMAAGILLWERYRHFPSFQGH